MQLEVWQITMSLLKHILNADIYICNYVTYSVHFNNIHHIVQTFIAYNWQTGNLYGLLNIPETNVVASML